MHTVHWNQGKACRMLDPSTAELAIGDQNAAAVVQLINNDIQYSQQVTNRHAWQSD